MMPITSSDALPRYILLDLDFREDLLKQACDYLDEDLDFIYEEILTCLHMQDSAFAELAIQAKAFSENAVDESRLAFAFGVIASAIYAHCLHLRLYEPSSQGPFLRYTFSQSCHRAIILERMTGETIDGCAPDS